jgi:hypothetical protein
MEDNNEQEYNAQEEVNHQEEVTHEEHHDMPETPAPAHG